MKLDRLCPEQHVGDSLPPECAKYSADAVKSVGDGEGRRPGIANHTITAKSELAVFS